jgi:transketolase
MRTAFIETLCELAEQDERIWLLTGDLGYSVLERFAERFPGRFVNVGVAEQNMTGVAAGLALCGKIVFTYSIANFPTLRCLEQIRNDICYHNLNVKIVAVGGGLAYGAQGYTHHAIEDLAVMLAMPNMTVIAPGDPVEARLAMRAIVKWSGPCFLRLGKSGEPLIHQKEPDFAIGKAITVREGSNVTIISTGSMLKTALEAADILVARGIHARVLSMHTVQPLDKEAVLAAARETALIATIEDHSAVGGLYSAIISALPRGAIPCLKFAIPNDMQSVVGSQSSLLELAGLTAPAIARAICNYLLERIDEKNL